MFQLAVRYPDIPVIIGHLGGTSWMEVIAAAKENRNIYIDLSAAYAAVEKAAAAVREELAAADQKHTKEMSNARNENERLRAAARTGAVSVRFTSADGPSPTADLSETPFASSLGNGTLTIDAELRERVFDHRAEVIQAERQILYLQDYARACEKGGTP